MESIVIFKTFFGKGYWNWVHCMQHVQGDETTQNLVGSTRKTVEHTLCPNSCLYILPVTPDTTAPNELLLLYNVSLQPSSNLINGYTFSQSFVSPWPVPHATYLSMDAVAVPRKLLDESFLFRFPFFMPGPGDLWVGLMGPGVEACSLPPLPAKISFCTIFAVFCVDDGSMLCKPWLGCSGVETASGTAVLRFGLSVVLDRLVRFLSVDLLKS